MVDVTAVAVEASDSGDGGGNSCSGSCRKAVADVTAVAVEPVTAATVVVIVVVAAAGKQ